MPRGTRHCRSSVAAAVLALAAAVLGTGCETPVVSRFELVPRAAARPDEVVIRRRVAPGEIDAERARRALAAWFDAATPDRRVSTPVAEWPAPEGCRWVLVPERLDVGAAVVTPRGRAVLVRTDDGVDLRLAELEVTAIEPLGRRRALRLRASEARRGALKALAGEGDVLLFVGGDDAPWAARVAEGLDDEVLLAGTTPAMEAALLGRAGRLAGTLSEGE